MGVDLTPVESSNIAAVGYDAATRVLTIKFKGGGTWDYHGVAPHLHAEMMNVHGSIGKYFHARIRGAHKATKREKVE